MALSLNSPAGPAGSVPAGSVRDGLRGASLDALLTEEAALSKAILAARTGTAQEPLTAAVYLRALTVRSAIARALNWGCQYDVREAIEAGATWSQVATARATTPPQARADFCRWIDAQAALWDTGLTSSGQRYGLDPRQRHALYALAGSNHRP